MEEVAALTGHVDVQCVLGCMYSFGEGVPIDNVKAFQYWKQAAIQVRSQGKGDGGRGGVSAAGVRGPGVHWCAPFSARVAPYPRRIGRHPRLCRRVASLPPVSSPPSSFQPPPDQKHGESAYNIGICYRDGKGLPEPTSSNSWSFFVCAQAEVEDEVWMAEEPGKSDEHALKWFTVAADQGHLLALLACGSAFYHGHGTNQDAERAAEYVGGGEKRPRLLTRRPPTPLPLTPSHPPARPTHWHRTPYH